MRDHYSIQGKVINSPMIPYAQNPVSTDGLAQKQHYCRIQLKIYTLYCFTMPPSHSPNTQPTPRRRKQSP